MKEERLTRKDTREGRVCDYNPTIECDSADMLQKLGKLEDILEKHNLSVEELDEALNGRPVVVMNVGVPSSNNPKEIKAYCKDKEGKLLDYVEFIRKQTVEKAGESFRYFLEIATCTPSYDIEDKVTTFKQHLLEEMGVEVKNEEEKL